ncbi:type II secretion system protein N [Desulfogranum japonicum]|uniref:type II secretion system protein N n=1 Tax=Desulfogranum japonicum TaxID=231447 RepID=UPI0003FED11A|nr:type II secretion system protein N [Desulfogranum japonicum]
MIKSAIILAILTACLYLGVSQLYAEVKERLDAVIPAENITGAGKQTRADDTAGENAGLKPVESSYGIIVARNIFQATLESVAPVKKDAEIELENLEETTLKLVLQGTVAGSDKDARAIIIDEREKRQDLYRVGDSIQNAVITQIERGKIVLEHNGDREILVLKERKAGGVSPHTRLLEQEPMGFPDIEPQSPEVKAPVVRPRRRISFRQQQPSPPQDEQETALLQNEPGEGGDQNEGTLDIPDDNVDQEQNIPENNAEGELVPPNELVE